MSFTARAVIESVSRVLFDVDNIRWPLPEMLDHINDAIRMIATIKPNACSETRTLYLAAGTLQTLPDECTVLSRVTRNIVVAHGDPGGPVGGDAIRMVSGRELMDAYFPGWQSDATMFGPKVQHAIYDLADPRRFYVIPGNDGTGRIEAIVGVIPDALDTSNSTAIADYEIVIPLRDTYRAPIEDYVAFRAFSKDQGVPASEARAAKHLGAFQTAMQAIAAAEGGSAVTSAAAKGA